MRHISYKFMISGSIFFTVFLALAFTPLAVLPILFSLAATGWKGLLAVLFITGAPFGGLLFLLIFTRRDRWKSEAAQLAGFWVGSIFGSVAGLKLGGGA